MGYYEKATEVKVCTRRCRVNESTIKQPKPFLKRVLWNFVVSLFFYAISFILSYIPVAVELYYAKVEEIPSTLDEKTTNAISDFISSWISESFLEVGVMYISISFLFVLLMDFTKDLILNNRKIGPIPVFILVLEVIAGCIGIIIFGLVMGSFSAFNKGDIQSAYSVLTRLYLIIAVVSLAANTIIGNLAPSNKHMDKE